MVTNMKFVSIVLVILLTMSSALYAQQGSLPSRTSGFYAGAGIGYNQTDLNSEAIVLSGNDFSFKVFGGYRFEPNFLPFNTSVSIEGAYVNLGKITDTVLGSPLSLETNGFTAYAIGTIPVFGNFDLFAAAGVIAWKSDLDTTGAPLIDDSGTDLALAVGMTYQTGSTHSARLELESFDFMDGAWLATFSLVYQFK